MATMRATAWTVAVMVGFVAVAGSAPGASAFCIPNPVTGDCLPDPEDLVPDPVPLVMGLLEDARDRVPDGPPTCDGFYDEAYEEAACFVLVTFVDCDRNGPDIEPCPPPLGPAHECLEHGAPETPCGPVECLWETASAQCMPVPPVSLPDVWWDPPNPVGGQGVHTNGVGEHVAVVQSVRVTFPGGYQETLLGVGTTDPCAPWSALFECEPDALAGPEYLYNPLVEPTICLSQTVYHVDVDGDGNANYDVPAIYPTTGNCREG